jgi:hypothetical protein
MTLRQERGAGWDIVDQAIATYDSWMLDDDFDANRILKEIIEQMRARRSLYMPHERAIHGEYARPASKEE